MKKESCVAPSEQSFTRHQLMDSSADSSFSSTCIFTDYDWFVTSLPLLHIRVSGTFSSFGSFVKNHAN